MTPARLALPSPHVPTTSESVAMGEPTGRNGSASVSAQIVLPFLGSIPEIPSSREVKINCDAPPPLGVKTHGVEAAAAFFPVLRGTCHRTEPVPLSSATIDA